MLTRDTILDIDIDIGNKEVVLITQNSGVVKKDFSFLASIPQLTTIQKDQQNVALHCVSSVKESLLSKIRDLIVATSSNESFKKALCQFDSNFLKKELTSSFSSMEETKEIESLKEFCYRDQKTGVKNSLFFNRYFGKDDIDFTTYNDFDEYNQILSSLNRDFTDTLLFCEFNNLKAINHLYGEDVGDEIIETFIYELNSLYSEPYIIRYGNDEFITLCSEDMANQIVDLTQNKEFISTINKSIQNKLSQNDIVDVFSTISVGKSSLYIPNTVFCKDHIIDFKKSFSTSYLSANLQSIQHKEELKKMHGHQDLKNDYIDDKAILEYHAHLISSSSSSSYEENSAIVDAFLDGNKKKAIDISKLGL